MKTKYLKIGALAKRVNLSTETLRYYEKEGLINASIRSENGYRMFSERDVDKLNFVLHAKQVGFSLREIKDLLDIRVEKAKYTCEDVKQLTGNKIQDLQVKIDQLQVMQRVLQKLHDACCGGGESAIQCSILDALEEEKLNGVGKKND